MILDWRTESPEQAAPRPRASRLASRLSSRCARMRRCASSAVSPPGHQCRNSHQRQCQRPLLSRLRLCPRRTAPQRRITFPSRRFLSHSHRLPIAFPSPSNITGRVAESTRWLLKASRPPEGFVLLPLQGCVTATVLPTRHSFRILGAFALRHRSRPLTGVSSYQKDPAVLAKSS